LNLKKSKIILLKTRRKKGREKHGISKTQNASTSNKKRIHQDPSRSNRKRNYEKHGGGIELFRGAPNIPLRPNQKFVRFETGHEMAKESQAELKGTEKAYVLSPFPYSFLVPNQ
jgi:hypothetical protein